LASSGTFLCGCTPDSKRGYSGDMKPNGIGGEMVYTDKRYDDDGFEVCPEHGMRMYGWQSADTRAGHYIDTGDGRPATFVPPKSRSKPLTSRQEDTRDVRDPQEVGAAIMAAGNGRSHSAN
jgi:hypothetical protein